MTLENSDPRGDDRASSPSRRTVINMMIPAVAAFSGAAALPAVASGANPDPIFAALENYNRAEKLSLDYESQADAINSKVFAKARTNAAPRIKSRTDFERENPGHIFSVTTPDMRRRFRAEEMRKLDNTPAAIERDRLSALGGEVIDDAGYDLAGTVPTTIGGAIAAIAFLRMQEERGLGMMNWTDDDGGSAGLTMLASIEKFLRRF